MPDHDEDRPFKPRTQTTQEINPVDVHGWPIVLGGLARLDDEIDLVFALRLGVLQQIRAELSAMTEQSAPADHVVRMRELVEVLAKLPWGPGARR